MAIYHLNVRGCSPATGAGAVKKAAYQSGQTLIEERTGEVCDYARKERVLDEGLALPAGGTGSPALFALFGKKGRPGGIPKNQSRVGGAAPSAPTPALAVWQRETGGRFPRGQVWRSTPSRGFRGISSPLRGSGIPRSP